VEPVGTEASRTKRSFLAWMAWHSSRIPEHVYRTRTTCTTGRHIPREGREGGKGGKQVKQIRIQMVTHLASVLHAWRGGSASV